MPKLVSRVVCSIVTAWGIKMKRALLVASVASMVDQFNMQNIKLLKELGYHVDVACNFLDGNTCSEGRIRELKSKLAEEKVGCYQIDFARDVLRLKQNIKAYRELRALARKKKYELVHCHAPIGGVLGRVVFRKYRNRGTRVIYTAHGFHFFKGAPVKNWMLFYPVEKFLSRWTDCLITINKEDYRRAKRKFHADRMVYVPGVGVDTKKFNSGLIDIGEKRASLGVMDNEIMLLSVGELSRRKNHEIVIRALKELNNPRIKYFIAGQGELQEYLSELIKNYGLEDKIFLLGYRTDISELCQAADLFIFPSKQEGMPVALMEAIACKTPVYCSDIRGNVELVHNKEFLFDPANKENLVSGLRNIIGENKPEEFKRKRSKEILENYNHLLCYDLNYVNTQMNSLYCGQGGGDNRMVNILKRQIFVNEIGITAEKTLLLSVGELNENKNHSTVIKAIAKMGDHSVHYIIAGRGVLQKQLEKLAFCLGVASQVHFLGFREDIADIMKVVDIYCLPSFREGLNVSLMEAIASGLPWIASDIRGNRDLFGKGKGCLLPPDNPEVWAENLKKMKKNQLKEKSNNKIFNFSVIKVESKMKRIYKNLYDEI